MVKIIIVPVDGIDEFLMLEKTVISEVNLKSIEPMLFIKLYELLNEIHKTGSFPIWGVPSGEKSSEANKWSRISQNDVLFFAKQNRLIGLGRVRTKFQSQNIAQILWPELTNSSNRQYLLTLESYNKIEEVNYASVDTICRKGKFELDTFHIIDNQYSLELLREFGLDKVESEPTSTSQGFGLTAIEKKVVEMHAVRLAIDHLLSLGYSEIEDVGEKESFDILAKSSDKHLSVEVKGSTGSAKSVILTNNEVNFQIEAYPMNGLFIVSNIELIRGEQISAQGGDIKFISPWLIDENELKPISFEYRV
jgi:hypothetical protein